MPGCRGGTSSNPPCASADSCQQAGTPRNHRIVQAPSWGEVHPKRMRSRDADSTFTTAGQKLLD
ncbi:hypothetical protein ACFPRL_23690 [Pseudoclavibacter helvolus]